MEGDLPEPSWNVASQRLDIPAWLTPGRSSHCLCNSSSSRMVLWWSHAQHYPDLTWCKWYVFMAVRGCYFKDAVQVQVTTNCPARATCSTLVWTTIQMLAEICKCWRIILWTQLHIRFLNATGFEIWLLSQHYYIFFSSVMISVYFKTVPFVPTSIMNVVSYLLILHFSLQAFCFINKWAMETKNLFTWNQTTL